MKKHENLVKELLFVLFMCVSIFSIQAQDVLTNELEKYAKENYGDSWIDAAENLSKQLVLDKNSALTYTEIINCGTQTKEQLYTKLNYWFASTFNDANSVIQMNDKENGTIIGVGFVEGIADHIGGFNQYVVHIRPVIKVDIKDTRIRVTYSVQCYNVSKIIGGGWLGSPEEDRVYSEQKWPLTTCWPFAKKDEHHAKKTSSKALVMTHAYSNVIMDKIKEAALNGVVGNENDEW